ncbi:MAG TPA: hypothetical protein VFP72_22115 [Kineosporiaceae bacterium]|nr:hypothetical protein [Kineosporiaceae bacterium]
MTRQHTLIAAALTVAALAFTYGGWAWSDYLRRTRDDPPNRQTPPAD